MTSAEGKQRWKNRRCAHSLTLAAARATAGGGALRPTVRCDLCMPIDYAVSLQPSSSCCIESQWNDAGGRTTEPRPSDRARSPVTDRTAPHATHRTTPWAAPTQGSRLCGNRGVCARIFQKYFRKNDSMGGKMWKAKQPTRTGNFHLCQGAPGGARGRRGRQGAEGARVGEGAEGAPGGSGRCRLPAGGRGGGGGGGVGH